MGQAAPVNAMDRQNLKDGLYLKSVVNGRVMIAGEPYIVPLTQRKRTAYVFVKGTDVFLYDGETRKAITKLEKEKYGMVETAI